MPQPSPVRPAYHRSLWIVFAAFTLLMIGFIAPPARSQSFSSLHSFIGPQTGTNPVALLQGKDGALYGTTYNGGTNDKGTLFKVNADGTGFVTLHTFTGSGGDGINPGALHQGKDGALYGTTSGGGTYRLGTLFRINLDGSGFLTLHSFTGSGGEGANPYAALLQGKDGALYGTTYNGGTNDKGTLFKVNADRTGFVTLHSFTGSGSEGANPYASVIQDEGGTLYGTTSGGGTYRLGTLFRINLDGSGFLTLHSFTGSGGEGANPYAAVIQGKDGALYGTTEQGGTNNYGTLFRINPDGTGFVTLYAAFNSEAFSPYALLQGRDNVLYGTLSVFNGTVFKVNTDGSGFAMLHSFTGIDGANPVALLQGTNGTLYGTTYNGGTNNEGTLFKVNADGTGFVPLHSFTGGEGATPLASVIQDEGGTLYGTTHNGGTNNNGTLFRINPDGSGFLTLLSFTGGSGGPGGEGNSPEASLLQLIDGTLYGTTEEGGTGGQGTIFKVNPDGSSLMTLHSFIDNGFHGVDGANPWAALFQGKDGALYGTTQYGGTNNKGTVFKINPDGSGFMLLHSFTGSGDEGATPLASVIQDKGGTLYGTTYWGGTNGDGTVFKINPDGSGFVTLHSFTGTGSGRDGTYPYAALIQGKDAALYGTTEQGGINGAGTLFKIAPDGSGFLTLHSFTGGSDGANPYAALLQGKDGALYGTTYNGGTNNKGTLFKVNADGTGLVTLHTFTRSDSEGANPFAALLQSTDGTLYGTTSGGGIYGLGTIFRLTLKPATLKSLALNPNPVAGGQNATGTLSLTAPAPIDTAVALASTNSAAAVPTTITIHAGKSSQTFTITTTAVSANATGNVTATLNGQMLSQSLTVRPLSVKALTVSPSTVAGTLPATGTVILEGAAPDPVVVSLTSDTPATASPAVSSVTIPAGKSSQTFSITTSAVTSNTPVTLTATANGLSKTALLTVRPIGVLSLTLLPAIATGGDDVVCVIRLEARAAPGPIQVTLSSSDPTLAPVPASVTIPSGKVTSPFVISTGAVTSQTTVTISATANGITKTVTLTLTP